MKKKKGDWQIRPSTFYLAVFLLTILNFSFPGGLEFIIPIASIPLFIFLRHRGHIKKADFTDLALIGIYTISGGIILGTLGAFTLANIPWYKIIIVGIAADVVASVLGLIPGLGDAVSSLVNAIMAITVIGGFEGGIVALVLVVISIIPGPSLGANTFFIIILKAISEAII